MGDSSKRHCKDLKHINLEDIRERRSRELVELRKAKKDELLLNRIDVTPEDVEVIDDTENATVDQLTFQQLCSDVFSCQYDKQLQGVKSANRILSQNIRNMDMVVKSGIIPRCIEYLQLQNLPELQCEVAAVLGKVGAGTSMETVLKTTGVVHPLIVMLGSSCTTVADAGRLALSSFFGSKSDLGDYIIFQGLLPKILEYSNIELESCVLLQSMAKTISNFCRVQSLMDAAGLCLPILTRLILSKDILVVADACWALSFLADSSEPDIDSVVKAGVVPRLLELLDNENMVLSPVLRAIGNIATGTEHHTHVIIEAGGLHRLAKLLSSTDNKIVEDAAWVLSNIAGGSNDGIITAIMTAGIIPLCINIIKNGDFRIQKEAIRVIRSVTYRGTESQVLDSLCDHYGIIPVLCNSLRIQDSKVLYLVLKSLDNICITAEGHGAHALDKIVKAIEECDGTNKIEDLMGSHNKEISEKATLIYDEYLDVMSETESEDDSSSEEDRAENMFVDDSNE